MTELTDSPVCYKCGNIMARRNDGTWWTELTGTWCIDESSHETADHRRDRVAEAIRSGYFSTVTTRDHCPWDGLPDALKGKWRLIADAVMKETDHRPMKPLLPEDALDGFIIRRCQKCGREHAPVRPCETASNPHPMVQIVCQVCGEPWEVHVSLSKYYDPDEDTWASDEITLLTCIAALKKRNQGPEGPVGPIGATGEPGPKTYIIDKE